MMRWVIALLLLATPTLATEEAGLLPAGEGRDQVSGLCTICHDSAVIRRSRLSRPQWDGLMDWMTERHGMPPLHGELRTTIVDYLAKNFGPTPSNARGRNPFLQ
jgi:hypothetical protein